MVTVTIAKPELAGEHQATALAGRLTGGRRLIVASNRGPVEHNFADDGSIQLRQGSGGVAITLSNITRYAPVTWVAAAMNEADRRVARYHGGITPEAHDLKLRLVAPHPKTYDAYYNLICNPILWFLQHGQWALLDRSRSLGAIEDGWAKGYVPINKAFARHILEELCSSSTTPIVMFHDYHLYLAPRYVRARAPQAILSHFIHIPWPPTDAWQQLPWPITRAILKGLLACDLVGFQTPESVQHFLLTCKDFIRGAAVEFEDDSVILAGHKTLVRSYPISVDVETLQGKMRSPAVGGYRQRLEGLSDLKTIVRVDRVDPVKNILAGFKAFDLLIREVPHLQGKVQFLAFMVPSRQAVPEYRSYAEAVFTLAKAINRQWGTPDWQPIHLFYEHNYDQALAALSLYDVLLVNSLPEGMNLVAKEGALVNERDGVLVLSAAAGAFRELGHAALPVSPNDVPETAKALATALFMPAKERRRRAAALRHTVETNDLSLWFTRQLVDLEELTMAAREVSYA